MADLDLFGHDRLPAVRRSGRRVHLPAAMRALAESMRAQGASVVEIAKALGIAQATCRKRLAAELDRGMPGGRRPGRPRWSPTAADRAKVAQLRAAGATQTAIAAAVGCSVPTLVRHCRGLLGGGHCDELEPGRAKRRGSPDG